MLFILLCVLDFDRIFYLWNVTHSDSALEYHAKTTHPFFKYLQKSWFQGWWNKGRSEGINSSNCLRQKSMKVGAEAPRGF